VLERALVERANDTRRRRRKGRAFDPTPAPIDRLLLCSVRAEPRAAARAEFFASKVNTGLSGSAALNAGHL
jgi:hypothetical protein